MEQADIAKIIATIVSRGVSIKPDALSKLAEISKCDLDKFIGWLERKNLTAVSAETINNFLSGLSCFTTNGITYVDYTEKLMITATADDWIKHFNSRYNKISKILRGKIPRPFRISDIKYAEKHVDVIGMLYDTTVSSKGHLLWEVEDPSGKCRVIIMKNKEKVMEAARCILSDAIIGISGTLGTRAEPSRVSSDRRALPVIFADELILPGIPKIDWPTGSNGVIVFISDTQIGSKYTMMQTLEKAVEEINKIKNLRAVVHLGDLVDALAVYPGHDEELVLKSFKEQYDAAASILLKIRHDVPIFIIPGNHSFGGGSNKMPSPSTPRTADTDAVFQIPNVKMLSDPAELIIDGKIRILLTHGISVNSILAEYGLSPTPDSVIHSMRAMLKHRHISPIYGTRQSQIMPTHEDYLVIENVPNVIALGHIHVASLGEYNGVRLLSVGGFQSETPYMKELNIEVSPPSYTTLDLKTGEAEIRYL